MSSTAADEAAMESWLTRLGVDVCLKGAIAVLLETSPRPDTLGAAIEVIVAELRTTCSRQHPTHLTRSGAEDWTPVAMARSEEVGEERKDDVLVEGDWIRVVVEDNVVRGRQLLLLVPTLAVRSLPHIIPPLVGRLALARLTF